MFYFLALGIILFGFGLAGAFSARNVPYFASSAMLMVLGVVTVLSTFNRFIASASPNGQVLACLVLTISALEIFYLLRIPKKVPPPISEKVVSEKPFQNEISI